MIIGVPKEIKNNENRVSATPSGVSEFVRQGHEVMVESGAGLASGFTDEEYTAAGASVVTDVARVWASEMVLKVKEPIPSEYHYFYEGLILFTYLHLAAEEELTHALIAQGVVAIAYETVQVADGTLPLLTPMSEVAGRMAVQVGAHLLEKYQGGKGVLLSSVPGVPAGKVTIVGGGVSGLSAARIAVGMGARVTILDVSAPRLREIDMLLDGRVQTVMSNHHNIASEVRDSDLVIGAVLIPGAKAPTLVTREMVASMQPGSVVVDIAIDQGGIFETGDRVSTHDDPTYVVDGIIHYSVANMPGAVPRTSTFALTNATLPYALKIANFGYREAMASNEALLRGLNVIGGKITFPGVAAAFGMDVTDARTSLTEVGTTDAHRAG